MSALTWDQTGERLYEAGVDKGVLYVHNGTGYDKGIAWNGLTQVNENPSGAETTKLYANNSKYLEMQSAEEYGMTVEAYTRPVEFEACDGSAQLAKGVTIGQQPRKSFGMAYRTKIGNDVAGEDYGYKIHLVYGCKAAPSSKGYQTTNENPEAVTLSWEVTTTPVAVAGYKPTSTLTIDSTQFGESDKAKLTAIENLIYGSTDSEPTLPTPEEILAIMNGSAA